MDPQKSELNKQIAERFKSLPTVVQDAITSANVEKHLRTLADSSKLHLDQWQILENEVLLTLLGFQPIENLEGNIKIQVGVTNDIAHALAENISQVIFEPIRQELERQLEHPEAQEREVSAVEAAAQQQLQSAAETSIPAPTVPVPPTMSSAVAAPATPIPTPAVQPALTTPPAATPASTIAPATPAAPAPDIKITRPSESTAYKPGELSHERKSVVDDPYREPIS